MIKVLIVEDDPMVAEFNKHYLNEIEGFTLVGVTHSVNEALPYVEKDDIDLVLLDVYMPGKNGLELLSYIRENRIRTDVILITAANNVDQIQTALRYGAVDYLIKPFEFDRFNQALKAYRDKHQFLEYQEEINQQALDKMILSKEHQMVEESTKALPKGLTKSTLKVILNTIKSIKQSQFSTDDIAEQADISRVSVRKYLKFLVDIDVLTETTTYGIGRPIYLYEYNDLNDVKLNGYI